MNPEDLKALVAYRMSQAETTLADARYLLEGERSPASIVNRCYYAMFYATLALLQTAGRAPSRHSGVHGLFDTEFVLKGILPRELSQDLHRAFELRQTSDYKTMEPVPKESARELLDRAARFVAAVRQHLRKAGLLPD